MGWAMLLSLCGPSIVMRYMNGAYTCQLQGCCFSKMLRGCVSKYQKLGRLPQGTSLAGLLCWVKTDLLSCSAELPSHGDKSRGRNRHIEMHAKMYARDYGILSVCLALSTTSNFMLLQSGEKE